MRASHHTRALRSRHYPRCPSRTSGGPGGASAPGPRARAGRVAEHALGRAAAERVQKPLTPLGRHRDQVGRRPRRPRPGSARPRRRCAPYARPSTRCPAPLRSWPDRAALPTWSSCSAAARRHRAAGSSRRPRPAHRPGRGRRSTGISTRRRVTAPLSGATKPRAPCGMNSVGVGAARATGSATEPCSQRGRPPRPSVASTMMSLGCSSRKRRIARTASRSWTRILASLDAEPLEHRARRAVLPRACPSSASVRRTAG